MLRVTCYASHAKHIPSRQPNMNLCRTILTNARAPKTELFLQADGNLRFGKDVVVSEQLIVMGLSGQLVHAKRLDSGMSSSSKDFFARWVVTLNGKTFRLSTDNVTSLSL